MTEQKTALDFEALRRAAEQNDAEALANLYTEDAEVLIVNRETPPSSPHVLRGREQIAEYLKDVCGREIKSSLENEVVGEERIAFNKACEYPDTEHFAERFGLFVILALGESIVITGATTAALELDMWRFVALGVAFLLSAALWWLYFTSVARIAQRYLELSEHRTLLARDAYTYLHVVIVAGVIVSAVGDELVIAHPMERLPGAQIAAIVAGPAIYLLAHVLFRWRMAGSLSRKRLFGALVCVVVGVVGVFVPALVVAVLLVAVLVAVIGTEYMAAARRRARGEPSPLERLEAARGQSHNS